MGFRIRIKNRITFRIRITLEFLCSKAPTVYSMKEVFFDVVKNKPGNTELINLTVIDVDKISVVQRRNISNML